MIADAALGFSAMAFRSAGIAFAHCEAAGSILLRMRGNAPKGHESLKTRSLTPRAKVGYCSCCVAATHVAAPRRYAQGEIVPLKVRGTSLWKLYGP